MKGDQGIASNSKMLVGQQAAAGDALSIAQLGTALLTDDTAPNAQQQEDWRALAGAVGQLLKSLLRPRPCHPYMSPHPYMSKASSALLSLN